MGHVCRHCKRRFASRSQLDLHEDTCAAGQLFCVICGERFTEAAATADGWHYRCPNGECSGAGMGEDIHHVADLRQPVP